MLNIIIIFKICIKSIINNILINILNILNFLIIQNEILIRILILIIMMENKNDKIALREYVKLYI